MRGTISQVFRAPNLNELYDGRTLRPTEFERSLRPPHARPQLAQHPAACQFVPPDWAGNSTAQVNTFYSGAATVGPTLKPEQGKSINIGLVYDPDWLPGLSTSVDFWHIYLSDTLTAIQARNTVVNSCFNNNAVRIARSSTARTTPAGSPARCF